MVLEAVFAPVGFDWVGAGVGVATAAGVAAAAWVKADTGGCLKAGIEAHCAAAAEAGWAGRESVGLSCLQREHSASVARAASLQFFICIVCILHRQRFCVPHLQPVSRLHSIAIETVQVVFKVLLWLCVP